MRDKAILVLPTNSSFMHVDANILSTIYDLKTLYLDQDISKRSYLKEILRALLTLATWRGCGRVLIWFADYHTATIVLLARLLAKKSYVFVGGYDAVCYPEFGMGVYCSSFRGFCARLALKHCDHIIANHQALLSSSNTYYKPSGHPEGIYRLIPGLKTPASVVHNAITENPADTLDRPRRKQILTVGTTPRLQAFYNKGFDLLTEVAKRRPDLNFIFVGIQDRWMPELRRKFPFDSLSNLTIHPHLDRQECLRIMAESAVYAQPSISEGMPNALIEAMLMGCVPVGSRVAGIPTVIGNHGFLIYQRDSHALEAALDKSLAIEPDRRAISEDIRTRFSLAARREKLVRLLRR